uniref:T9SS type A sorting domain-containing protein n=1 Tax=Flavobacterium sp. TaxID=239 RepID=UPI004049FC2F
MKTKILLLLFSLWGLTSYAQSFQWIKDGGSAENLGSNDYEQVYSIATDSQKNTYVLSKVGMSNLNVDGNPKSNYDNPSSTPTDIVLASFSCDGTYRWSKIIGGGDTEVISAVQVDSQDNVYIAGRILSCDDGTALYPFPARIDNDYVFVNSPSACSRLFLAKFNTNGILQYVKRPEPNLTNTPSFASYGFELQNDVIYWFVWLKPGTYADGALINTNTDPQTPFVLKYNLDGSFIEGVQLGTFQFNGAVDSTRYYRNPHNGNYYMTCIKTSSSTTLTINGQPVINSAALVCYDANGNYLWKRENNNNTANNMKFFDIGFDPQNNIYIAGYMTGLNLNSFMGYSIAIANVPAFIMKLDATADNLLWATHHDSVGSGDYGALVYNGNEVAYTGWCAGTNFTWGTQSIYVTATNEGQDVLLARFNSTTGACLSLHNIPSTVGSTDRGTALAVDASGDYLVGGGFAASIYDVNNNAVVNEGGTTDFFIAKFATQACTPLSNEDFETATIKVYPNPVVNQVTVTITENVNYTLYTITGQLIKQGKLTQANNTINLQEVARGYYVLKIVTESGNTQSIKVLIE